MEWRDRPQAAVVFESEHAPSQVMPEETRARARRTSSARAPTTFPASSRQPRSTNRPRRRRRLRRRRQRHRLDLPRLQHPQRFTTSTSTHGPAYISPGLAGPTQARTASKRRSRDTDGEAGEMYARPCVLVLVVNRLADAEPRQIQPVTLSPTPESTPDDVDGWYFVAAGMTPERCWPRAEDVRRARARVSLRMTCDGACSDSKTTAAWRAIAPTPSLASDSLRRSGSACCHRCERGEHAMIATTIMSSTRVNPRLWSLRIGLCTLTP